MAVIPLDDPRPAKGPALLQLGFRPFFLLAGLAAIVLMLLWLHSISTGQAIGKQFSGTYWHSHEMLFGYTAAVVSGFMLTAVKNWTGMQTIKNKWLAGLAAVWLLARIAPFINMPAVIGAIVSIMFFPLLAFAISIPLIKSDSKNNLIFIPLMLLFGLAEVLFQLGANQWLPIDANSGSQLFLHLIIILLALMGGRVIPFFIERTTGGTQPLPNTHIEKLMYVSLIAWAAANLLFASFAELNAVLALVAAVFQLVRLRNWHIKAMWHSPMLWILYLGYAWLTVGLLLDAATVILPIPKSATVHAFTVGAIGMITLGMMARVALGHTGRTIQHNGLIVSSFVLISLAPVTRVFWPLLQPDRYLLALQVSGALWVAAFVLFVLQYFPVLTRQRIDGRAG